MPGFADITRVARGEETVPGWRDIMEMQKEPQAAAVEIAARHVWLWVSAQAKQGSAEFQQVKLGQDLRGKPAFTEGSGRSGWRWDGVFGDVFIALWPTLNGKIQGSHRDPTDPEIALAISFRNKVSRRLRVAGNAINVHPGGARGSRGEFETPQWFIADEYSREALYPADPPRSKQNAGYDGEDAIAQRARKLTAAQAGEDKTPAPVITTYTCRAGCGETFTSKEARDKHEISGKHVKQAPAKVQEAQRAPQAPQAQQARPGENELACRVCGIELSTRGNRNQHEKNMHPGRMDLFPYACLYPGCNNAFNDLHGLTVHLGPRGHGLGEQAARSLKNRAQALAGVKTARKPETPEDAPAPVAASVPNAQRAKLPGRSQAAPAAQSARAVAQQRTAEAPRGEAEVSEDQVEAYVRRLMTADSRAQLAEAEARKLRQELEEKDHELSTTRSKLKVLRNVLGEE